jgi:cytoskeletal protein CcmA (bactofilin family)
MDFRAQRSPPSPGYGVQFGSSSNINGGWIGSLKLFKTTGSATINGNVFSKGTIVMANSNLVSGRIAAANIPTVGGTILQIGSNANIGGNIDVNGNIVISGGVVKGKVTHSPQTTYVGPAPTLGETTGSPDIPSLPALPPIAGFINYNSSAADITKTGPIFPVANNSIKLTGNQILTFKGPGTYTINQIDNKNGNTFIFDFLGKPGRHSFKYPQQCIPRKT